MKIFNSMRWITKMKELRRKCFSWYKDLLQRRQHVWKTVYTQWDNRPRVKKNEAGTKENLKHQLNKNLIGSKKSRNDTGEGCINATKELVKCRGNRSRSEKKNNRKKWSWSFWIQRSGKELAGKLNTKINDITQQWFSPQKHYHGEEEKMEGATQILLHGALLYMIKVWLRNITSDLDESLPRSEVYRLQIIFIVHNILQNLPGFRS